MNKTALSITAVMLASIAHFQQEAAADELHFEFLYEFGEFCG